MAHWKKIVLGFAIVLFLGVISRVIVISLALDNVCANTVVEETFSPQRELKAVVFERSCGATTGFSTQVSILAVKQEIGDDGGNVHIIGGHPEGAGVIARWIDGSHLEIRNPSLSEAFLAERSWGEKEVRISYVPTGI